MARLMRRLRAVDPPDGSGFVKEQPLLPPDLQSGGPAAGLQIQPEQTGRLYFEPSATVWTRANIGEVLPGVVTPLTWSVFRANLLCQSLSKVEADSSPNGPLRLIEGRAYLRLDALLGSFCYLPGVDPNVICQALGVDWEVHRSDGWKPRGSLLARLSGGLFLAEVLGLSPVLWLQLARLGAPPTGGAFQLGSEAVGLSNLSLRAPKGRSNLMADQRLLHPLRCTQGFGSLAPRNDICPRTEMRPPTDESLTREGVSTSAALVHRIEKLMDWNTRCFQLHLKCTRYAIGAYGLLTYMLRHWLPTARVDLGCVWSSRTCSALTERETSPVLSVVEGFATPEENSYSVELEGDWLAGQAELQTAEQGLALWRLAEQARAHPNVAAVLEDEVDWTTAQRVFQSTEEGQNFLEALAAFLSRHGARTVEEFELASPRWREDPTFVLTVIRNYLHADPALDPAADLSQRRALGDAAINHVVQQMGPLKGWLFRRVLRAYKAYVPLRENMKYRLMEGYEALRHCFLALGNRLCTAGVLDAREDIFFLTAAEALAAGRDSAVKAGEIRAKVNRRRAEQAGQERFHPSEVIVGNDLAWALDDNGVETLRGIGCSPGYAVGKARVIRDISMASHLQPGEVLVAPSTDPGWTPLFLTAAAVVTDIGGFLSHGATVAREYGIPAVVNTKRASELIQNGQVIAVDGNRGIVYLCPRNLFGCG